MTASAMQILAIVISNSAIRVTRHVRTVSEAEQVAKLLTFRTNCSVPARAPRPNATLYVRPTIPHFAPNELSAAGAP
jgi:hypothetical protein